MSWSQVIGRVAFTNCDPLFHNLGEPWRVLAAPPAWLTGHVLRQDCLTAPIPTADYAKHHSELMLLPDLGIVGLGAVGSVILFGSRNLEMMRDIALPSDSSTSKVLLRWLLNNRGLDPKCIETGPDLDSMLQRCDGALLIGDRALVAAESHPDMIRLDLGREWKRVTGLPMVFGVFACRRDAPKQDLLAAHADLIRQYHRFENDEIFRTEVIRKSAKQVGAEEERIARYFQNEVRNLMDTKAKEGLLRFLSEVCGMTAAPVWFSPS